MALPIIGPVTTSSGGTAGSRSSYWLKTGYTQAKPFDRVLQYDYRRCDLKVMVPPSSNSYDAYGLAAGFDMLNELNGWRPDVYGRNILYDRFKEKMSSNASLGVSLAELKQSYGMITNLVTKLVSFGRHVKAGRFGDAAHALGLLRPPKGVSRKKQASSNYLEFHFGWSPLIADIYDVCDVLQSPLKGPWIRATVSEKLGRLDLSTPTKGSNPSAYYPGYTEWETYRYWDGERRFACGAQVAVTNPNLWLANQLGLINPLTIAWELVPFSFVADWFVNLGTVVNSMTDYYGLTLTKEWTTTTYRGTCAYYNYARYRWWDWGYPGGGRWVYGSSVFGNSRGTFIHTRRQVGLPKPTFVVRPFKVWGWRRAAAAVSLLTLQLDGIQRRR